MNRLMLYKRRWCRYSIANWTFLSIFSTWYAKYCEVLSCLLFTDMDQIREYRISQPYNPVIIHIKEYNDQMRLYLCIRYAVTAQKMSVFGILLVLIFFHSIPEKLQIRTLFTQWVLYIIWSMVYKFIAPFHKRSIPHYLLISKHCPVVYSPRGSLSILMK